MKTPFNKLRTLTVVLQKSDFTPYAANDMGIWKLLTNEDDSIECVEVKVVRVEK